MKTKIIPYAVASTLALLAGPALAQANPWDAGFTLSIGAYSPEAETTLRLDGSGGRFGTALSFEGDLGGEDRKTAPTLDFLWRFNPRHALEGSIVSLRRDGSTTLRGTIDFGDRTFPVNSQIDSTFDSDIVRVAYRYSPIHDDTTELGLLFGLHYTKLKTSIVAVGSGITLSEEASVDYPLPTLGLQGSARFADNWRVVGMAQLLKLKIDEYDGELYNFNVALEWAFTRSFFAGLGYDYYKYSLSSTKERARGEFEYRFDGPKVYLGWNF